MTLKIEVLMVALLVLPCMPADASGGSGPGPRTPDDDNDYQHASEISSDVPVSEDVDVWDDIQDWYKITVQVGQTIKAVLDITDLSANLNLSLLDHDRHQIEKITSGGRTRGTAHLNFERQIIYVVVEADDCLSDYTLTVTLGSPAALTSGVAASGDVSVDGTDHADHYQIAATAGKTLKMVLNFTNLSANLSLRLWDPAGNNRAYLTSGGQSRGSTCLATRDGTYYIEVRARNDTSDYKLTVTVAYPPSISSGVRVSSALDMNGTERVHYYIIDVLSEQTIRMVLDFTDLEAEPSLRLMNATGYIYQEAGVSSGGLARGNTYMATSNGTFYFEVYINHNNTDYSLTVTLARPPVLSPGDTVSGSLSLDGADRADYYRFWLAGNVSGKSEVAILDITQVGQYAGMYAEIFDNLPGYGKEVYNESWNLSKKASLSASASCTGWYFCKVFIKSGSSGYILKYTRSTATSDGDNDRANATPVPRNGVMYGNASKARDHYDWFSYVAAKDDDVSFNLTRLTGTDQFTLFVYNSTQYLGYKDETYDHSYLNFYAGTPPLQNETFYIGIGMHTAWRADPAFAATDDESYMDYSLTIISSNQPPRLTKGFDNLAMKEDEKMRLKMSYHFYDIDDDILNYNVTGSMHIKGTYYSASDELELTPTPSNWYSTVTEYIKIVADDGRNGSCEAQLSATVQPVEDPPILNKTLPNVTMPQNGTDSTLDLSNYFIDNDTAYGDRLAWGAAGNGSLLVNISPAGKVTLFAPIDFWGIVNLTFTATDNASLVASSECKVTVSHVNQPPQVKARPPAVTVSEDETATLDLAPVFWDPDGDRINVVPSGSIRISVTQLNGTLTMMFTPPPDVSDFYEDIRLTAWDDKGLGGNFVVVRVTVVPVNDPPRIVSIYPDGDVVMKENQSKDFGISAYDPENGPVVNYTWSLDGQPVMLGVTGYTYRTNFSSAGCHTVAVVVDDGEFSTTKAWNVTVLNMNHEPANVAIISPKPGAVTREGVPVLLEAQAQDQDGDALEYTWLDGSRTLGKGRTLSIVLPNGIHTITLEVSDGEAVVTSKAVKITVKANTPPKMDALSPTSGQRFAKGDRIRFAATFSDAENDALCYCWTEDGKVLSTSPSFDKSDLPIGKHVIALAVSDGILTTDTTITVEVADKGKGGFIPGTGALALGVAALAAVAAARTRRRRGPVPA